jgi:hypothetical protein
MDRVLLPYSRAIIDANKDRVPGVSWGSTVVAATYRSFCEALTRTRQNANLIGWPLLPRGFPLRHCYREGRIQ